ncbi:MAG: hypothetical protein JW888_10735 [Pirellulales bacterium]|nr:hypothetical protein [Pirellulales bacterium]
MYSFVFNGLKFDVSLGYPPPCGEDEKDHDFTATLIAAGLNRGLETREVLAWILGRLARLVGEGFQDAFPDRFENDGCEFALRFKVTEMNGQIAGKCGVIFYPDEASFAGYSKEGHDVKRSLLDVLLQSPDDLGRVEVVCYDPDSGQEHALGWDGQHFVTRRLDSPPGWPE